MIKAFFNKFFIQFRRNKISTGLVFIFPIFFLFIFSIAFGSQGFTETTTYNIAVINNDTGIPENLAFPDIPSNWVDEGVGKNLSDIIFSVEYKENGVSSQKIFREVNLDDQSYTTAVEDDLVVLAMIIPENFSLMVLNKINNNANLMIPGFPTDVNASLEIIGKEESFSYPVASSIIQSIVGSFLDSFEEQVGGNIQINSEVVLPDGNLDIFDFIAAGLFVFATILAASLFTPMLLMDEQHKLMGRIKISLVEPWQYLVAYISFSAIIMIIQAIILFPVANWFFGFEPRGSYTSGFTVLLFLLPATYGLIFTVAAIVKTADAAGGLIGGFSSLIGFASNMFMPMPEIVIARNVLSFTSGSPHLLLWDILPWTHAVNALRAIFLYDQSLAEVSGDITLLLIMGLSWFTLGLILFMKRRFAMEE